MCKNFQICKRKAGLMECYSQFSFWLHFKINLFIHLFESINLLIHSFLKSIYLLICLSTELSVRWGFVCLLFSLRVHSFTFLFIPLSIQPSVPPSIGSSVQGYMYSEYFDQISVDFSWSSAFPSCHFLTSL